MSCRRRGRPLQRTTRILVKLCREKVRRAKAQLELSLVTTCNATSLGKTGWKAVQQKRT